MSLPFPCVHPGRLVRLEFGICTTRSSARRNQFAATGRDRRGRRTVIAAARTGTNCIAWRCVPPIRPSSTPKATAPYTLAVCCVVADACRRRFVGTSIVRGSAPFHPPSARGSPPNKMADKGDMAFMLLATALVQFMVRVLC